jgi:hypothetical protein
MAKRRDVDTRDALIGVPPPSVAPVAEPFQRMVTSVLSSGERAVTISRTLVAAPKSNF